MIEFTNVTGAAAGAEQAEWAVAREAPGRHGRVGGGRDGRAHRPLPGVVSQGRAAGLWAEAGLGLLWLFGAGQGGEWVDGADECGDPGAALQYGSVHGRPAEAGAW